MDEGKKAGVINFVICSDEYLFKLNKKYLNHNTYTDTITFDYSEDFELVGTSHQTGISEYFTWDYDGQKNIINLEMQKVSITINPNGETIGSVSVDILEN